MKYQNNCDNCGNCTRCGECCAAMLPISRIEEKRIREYITQNNIKPEFLQNDKDLNLQCCFYDRTKKICKIYAVRPKICRTFKCNKDETILDKEKEIRHSEVYWNRMVNDKTYNITDMRLLFYDDPRNLIANIIYAITNGTMQCTKKQFEFVKEYLKENGQAELANCIKGEFTNERCKIKNIEREVKE